MTFGNPANQPQFQYDAPVGIIGQNIAGGNTFINFPGSFTAGNPLIDVSQFESIIVRYVPNPASVTISLAFQWFPYSTVPVGGTAVDILGIDNFRWTSIDHEELTKTLPCRGNGLFISLNRTGGVAANTDFMRVYGSNRIANSWMMFAADQNNGIGDRFLGSATVNPLASATTMSLLPTARYDGPIIVTADCGGGATAQPILLLVRDMNYNVVISSLRDPGFVDLSSNRNEVSLKCVATRNTWQAQLINLSSSNLQATINVVAAPEGT